MKLNLLSLSLGSYHVISHIYGFAKRDQGQPRKDNKLLYRHKYTTPKTTKELQRLPRSLATLLLLF